MTSMKNALTDLSPVKKQLAIEVPTEEVERETDGVLRAYAKKVRLPGFRPGKTPIGMLRERFSDAVREDVQERLVSRAFVAAAQEHGLRPIGDPSLEDVEFEAGKPLKFKTTFEVLPQLEVKGYRELEAVRPRVAVADEEVDQTLDHLRRSRARHVEDPERIAEEGDIVVVDVAGNPEDGEPFSHERIQIEIGAENNLPEFNRHLAGVAREAEVGFEVTYPDEFRAPELAGKRVEVAVRVHEVKRREIPELDDEFAKDLAERFEGLDDLRSQIRQDIEARKKSQAEETVRQALLDKLLLENVVVIPDVLVEREIQRRLEGAVREMMMQGVDPEKADVDWKQLRDRQEEPARKSVHARLVLDAVAAEEKIEVSEADATARIRAEAERTGQPYRDLRKRIDEQGGTEPLKIQMVREKTLDYLTSVANIRTEE